MAAETASVDVGPEAKIAMSAERRRHDRDIREVRAVLAPMIATVVRSGLPIEPVDDHQLTAVAITGGRDDRQLTAVAILPVLQWEPRPAVRWRPT